MENVGHVAAEVLDLLGLGGSRSCVGFGFGCIFDVDVDVDVKLGEYTRFAFKLGTEGRGLECG
jgi:hypothetical protein